MSDIKGRLYLSREIYVDAGYDLPQHQIDGIRFLYKLYITKKSGAIINDPPGYGKRLQVVLFLNAVKALEKPVLVICGEDAMEKWKAYFFENTDFLKTSGVKVVIETMCNLTANKRREWSVVIVDADTLDWHKLVNDKDRAAFQMVDYKVWISSEDIKNDLEAFSKIYKWICPKAKFNIEEFISKTNNIKDIVTEAIRLDSFFQNIFIRGKNYDHQENQNSMKRSGYPIRNLENESSKSYAEKKQVTLNKMETYPNSFNDNENTLNNIYSSNTHRNQEETELVNCEMVDLEIIRTAECGQSIDDISNETIVKKDNIITHSDNNDKTEGAEIVETNIGNDLDAKMKQLEERVLKKFKGTIFDRIL